MSDPTTAVLATEEFALVTAAARADRTAFAQLYRAHVEAIYSYLYRRTGDAAFAEDLTAATFEAAWRDIARFEWRGVPFRAWLYRLAGMRLAMHRRRVTGTDETRPDDPDQPHRGRPVNESASGRLAGMNTLQRFASAYEKRRTVLSGAATNDGEPE